MKKYLFSVHSLVDVITNSSSELFIVDENKVEETMKELFKFICELETFDYESEIIKFDDYKYKDSFIIPEEYQNNTSSLYVINVDHSNILFQEIIEKYFNPIELEDKY